MADAGFFKGTSAEQDSRFANKQKKLLKQMKFPDNIDVKIDMLKVSLDVMKPWITQRLQELLGIEDDVVIEFVFNQLEDKNPDPKMMQINLTGFLGGSKARLFIGELWKFLASAQTSPDGIPAELVELKKKELLKRQEEDNRLREIRKREEDTYRQDIKPDVDKLDNKSNGRNQVPLASSKARNENSSTAGYKSRSHYDDDRRDRDRRRSPPPKTRRARDSRSPELKSRRNAKKPTRSISKSSDNENDLPRRLEKTKIKSNQPDRHHSPSHSRSPIKSRKNDPLKKHQGRSSSSSSNASDQATTKAKPKARSPSSSSNASHSHRRNDKLSQKKSNDPVETKRRKTNENNTVANDEPVKGKSSTSPPRPKQPIKKTSPIKESTSSKSRVASLTETKRNKKQSKRTRSSSASRSNSNSSYSSSISSEHESNSDKKQKKKPQLTKSGSSSRSPSPSRNKKSEKKKDDHKSKKHSATNSKSSSRKQTKHQRSNSNNKRKSHRDIELHRSPSPKKPRLESQIRVQTPPPSKLVVDSKPQEELLQQSPIPIKPNRTERIVVLEESRTDGAAPVSTRVSITTKKVYNEERPMNTNNSSEDENEIDLRERLLREKAIKSMRRRQPPNNDDINTRTTSDRIVYETQ